MKRTWLGIGVALATALVVALGLARGVAWAQRQYALRWWNREGKGRRAKKRAKSHRRTKR